MQSKLGSIHKTSGTSKIIHESARLCWQDIVSTPAKVRNTKDEASGRTFGRPFSGWKKVASLVPHLPIRKKLLKGVIPWKKYVGWDHVNVQICEISFMIHLWSSKKTWDLWLIVHTVHIIAALWKILISEDKATKKIHPEPKNKQANRLCTSYFKQTGQSISKHIFHGFPQIWLVIRSYHFAGGSDLINHPEWDNCDV